MKRTQFGSYRFANVPATNLVSISETYRNADDETATQTETILMTAETAAQLLAALPALIAVAKRPATLPSTYRPESMPGHVTTDSPAFLAFIREAQRLSDEHYDSMNYSAAVIRPRIEFEAGPRYVRVIRAEDNGKCYDRSTPTDCELSRDQHTPTTGHRFTVLTRSAHAFIDRENGNVLKPDGWKRPAKGPRGNIYTGSYGLTPYGAAYRYR